MGRCRAVHRPGRTRASPFCAPTSTQIRKVKCFRANIESQGPTPDLGRPGSLPKSEPPCGQVPTGVRKSERAGSGWRLALQISVRPSEQSPRPVQICVPASARSRTRGPKSARPSERNRTPVHNLARSISRVNRRFRTLPDPPLEVGRRYRTLSDPFSRVDRRFRNAPYTSREVGRQYTKLYALRDSGRQSQSCPTFRPIAFVSEQRRPAVRPKYSHFWTFLPVRIGATARFLPVRPRRRPRESASSPSKHRTTMRGVTIRHGPCHTVPLGHGPCHTVLPRHGFCHTVPPRHGFCHTVPLRHGFCRTVPLRHGFCHTVPLRHASPAEDSVFRDGRTAFRTTPSDRLWVQRRELPSLPGFLSFTSTRSSRFGPPLALHHPGCAAAAASPRGTNSSCSSVGAHRRRRKETPCTPGPSARHLPSTSRISPT